MKRLALSLFTIAALLLGTAAPAQAITTCPTAAACVWTSASYTGTRTVINGFPCVNIIPNNAATSLKVNASPSSNDWIFYRDANCSEAGGFITYDNGTSIAKLATAVNDQFSSAGPA